MALQNRDSGIKSRTKAYRPIFWFVKLLYNKVDFTASDFEAAVHLQIEVKQKMLGTP